MLFAATAGTEYKVAVDGVDGAGGVGGAQGSDYVATSGTLTFQPGLRFLSVPVQVKGDTVKEPAETFTVNLSNPTGGFSIANGSGVVTITNDD